MLDFDYVIVGAGSAGCVLANRLSADPRCRVALVEAGGPDDSPLIRAPLGLALLVPGRTYNWHFHTEPQAELGGRRLFWPRGKALGGSSSINAMLYTRGHPTDYDDWAALGNEGWSHAEVLPYFRRSEGQLRGADAQHGDSGPLTVSDLGDVNDVSRAALEAGLQAGHAPTDDFNGPEQEGWGWYQMTRRHGQRCSAARAFLEPARDRPNLRVFVKALTTRIELQGRRATGVDLVHEGQRLSLRARREVIVSGGAIGSPQLLMLSGIGAGAELREAGVAPAHELPGVGKHLLDHLDVMVQHRCVSKRTHGLGLAMVPRGIKALWDYNLRRRGIICNGPVEVGGFLKTSPELPRPDVQLQFIPAIMRDHGARQVLGYGYTLHMCQLRPWSHGHIRLVSPDATQAPAIQPRYLSDPRDLPVMIAGVRLCREVLSMPALRPHRGEELLPGARRRDDDAIAAYIRSHAETIYHPVGTCKMGSDPMAVVDARLRVHGLTGLRVVDASVMPTLIGGNTNAPTIMIAEKAADLILQEAGA
ncbi:GMC family oxidoreductase [Aquabacterium sp.]|uniref:GMC family oxidoreductase n=1 Tax=Aquabacterium sp. TaxID=1872578 RepID=UPI0035ADDAE9